MRRNTKSESDYLVKGGRRRVGGGVRWTHTDSDSYMLYVLEDEWVAPTSAKIFRNWFFLSRLVTIVAVNLEKPYAKSESGMNLVMYNVY